MKYYKILLSVSLITTSAGTALCAQAGSPAPAMARALGPRGPVPVGRSLWRVPTIVELGAVPHSWKVGVPSSAFQGLTLSEAAIRTDDLELGYVEGSNTQWASPEIRKNLDYNLTPAELTVVKNRLSKFHVQMLAYHVETLGPDDATRWKVFEFAKAMGVEMIVSQRCPPPCRRSISLQMNLTSNSRWRSRGDLARSVDGFEQAVLPVLGNYMIQRSKLLTIRGAEELAPDIKKAIEAAIPRTAPAKPIKPRKLLVMDEHMTHESIPNANYALELMGKSTGAFEVVFSNDLDNLKYDKIRQFDAVMLNSSESDISADPAVRAGLLRFVREGGGLGGIHAASWSAAFWPEFMEMLGASQGPHRTQSATVKIDDPDSPVTKSFGGQSFTYTDEYYRMTDTGLQGAYYSRDKVHVLLSVDLARTPDFNAGRAPFIRQDNDYAVAWIKGYGKGRVFFSSMGHTPQMFMDAKLNEFLLAAMQFILGDLPADTAPSADLGAKSHGGVD